MERIVIYNAKNADKIIKCASNMRIKSIIADDNMLTYTLKAILDNSKIYKASDTFPVLNKVNGSIVIFCELTDKHIDKLLFEMRNGGCPVDYKAVMTNTNMEWTLKHILVQMERESIEYKIKD